MSAPHELGRIANRKNERRRRSSNTRLAQQSAPFLMASRQPTTRYSLFATRHSLVRHDRLGGVADRFHAFAHVEEGDDAAGTAFEALVAPRERADQAALVEHELDVAAEILGVQQSLLERPIVEREHVGL